MIQCLDRTVVPNQSARFLDDVASAGEMRNGAQNVLATLLQWKTAQQGFQSRLILEVQNFLEFRDLTFRQADAIDDAAEEIHAAEIDLEIRNSQPLESFNRDQKDLDVRRLALASKVFDADLRKLPLAAAFRLLEAKNLAGVVKTNRAGQPCSAA